jgi:hypothetical protein
VNDTKNMVINECYFRKYTIKLSNKTNTNVKLQTTIKIAFFIF